MDHRLMKERMSDLYDGELSGKEREEALSHRDSCGECRDFYARLGAFSLAVAPSSAPASGEAFVRGVMDRLPRKNTGPRIVPVQWFAPAVGMAAMLLIALFPAPGTVSAEEVLAGGQGGTMADLFSEEA